MTPKLDVREPGNTSQVAAATNVLFDYSRLVSRNLIGKPIPRPDKFLSKVRCRDEKNDHRQCHHGLHEQEIANMRKLVYHRQG
jgi:hypothetical protein